MAVPSDGAVWRVAMQFVFGPRFTKAKRYVLCPWIDMLNHDGNQGGSDIAYEYFADAFRRAPRCPHGRGGACGAALVSRGGARHLLMPCASRASSRVVAVTF